MSWGLLEAIRPIVAPLFGGLPADPGTSMPVGYELSCQLRIVGVAISYNHGFMLSAPRPARHPDLLRRAHELGLHDPGPAYQGFVTSEGVFVDRKQALEIAIAAGQVVDKKSGNLNMLFSEDLW